MFCCRGDEAMVKSDSPRFGSADARDSSAMSSSSRELSRDETFSTELRSLDRNDALLGWMVEDNIGSNQTVE